MVPTASRCRGSAQLLAYANGYGSTDTRQATAGTVTIGTDYVPGTTLSSVSGTSGIINVASGALIDVSAKNPGDRLVPLLVNGVTDYEVVQGDQGGSVMFRAPVIENASNQETVNVNIANSNSIVGATGISVQGFRRWDLEAVANSGDFTGVTYNSAANTVTLNVTAGLDTANADGSTTAIAGVNFLGDNDPGTLVNFVQNFNIAADDGSLGGLASQSNFTANPGLDLETSGNIQLASNWNLGAGTVNQTAAVAAGYMVFNAALGKNVVVSGDEAEILADDTSLTYRVGGKVTGAPGILSLRAGGNLTLGTLANATANTLATTASITDGFFAFRDQSDGAYQAAVSGNAKATVTTQDAPYNAAANSPAAQGNDPLGSAVVFPLLPNGSPVSSWSYNLVAGAAGLADGAGQGSSNPSLIDPTSTSNLTVQGSSTYKVGALTTNVYTQLRTGTGDISLAAADNVDLTGGPLTYMNSAGTAVSTTPTAFIVGGPAVYTVGHIEVPQIETLVDSVTDASVTIDPEDLLPPSLFSSSQAYEYGRASEGIQGVYLTDPVYLEGGGSVNVHAGMNVLGRIDTNFSNVIKTVENNQRIFYPFIGSLDELWYIGEVGASNTAAINPQLFKNGLGALGGGDITVSAGGDINDVSAFAASSLTTATATPNNGLPTSALLTMGSGNVTLNAASNILGGQVDIASGTAIVTAGGNIAATQYQTGPANSSELSDEFFLRIADASASLTAGGSISIEGTSGFAPSLSTLQNGASGNSSIPGETSVQNRYGFYSQVSGLNLLANGNVTLTDDSSEIAYGGDAAQGSSTILPASFESTAIAGNVDVALSISVAQVLMIPSPQGELEIFAGGSIPGTTIGMLDSDPSETPGLFSQLTATDATDALSANPISGFVLPIPLSSTPDIELEDQHNKNITHANDPEPVYIYASGDIGSASEGLALSTSKETRVYAGQDITNMMFFGQNDNSSSVTRIVAGRDIIGTSKLVEPLVPGPTEGPAGPSEAAIEGNTFVIGGPGQFFLEAGRNLGPFLTSVTTTDFFTGVGTAPNFDAQETFGGGVISVGNQWNPYLPAQGASLNVFFGVGDGEDFNALRDAYVAPGTPETSLAAIALR